ncbi:MAG: AAA family ATPase, partial [Acidaminococcales bacterium]|nr:AAA family ATPase [Acidaminococcales bacterium]
MNITIGQILKFIFPEIQIYESARTYGFIAKRGQSAITGQAAAQTGSMAVKSAAQHTAMSGPKLQNGPAADTAVYSGKSDVKASAAQVERKIAAMRRSIADNFVGQQEAVDSLLVAFKRPFVTGFPKDAPQNTFFIIGADSSGRHTLLQFAVSAAKREGLLNYEHISRIDLSFYPSSAEKNLFLSDVYKALYEHSDIVLFENFENSHADILSVVSTLVIRGKYRFNERYAMQSGNLMPITGTLTQTAVSEMAANGKYFVFMTKAGENKIADVFGPKFMDKVADFIFLGDYSNIQIAAITKTFLAAFTARVRTNLGMALACSERFSGYAAAKYKKAVGLRPVEQFIAGDLYKALSEFKLRTGGLGANVQAVLDVDPETNEFTLLFDKCGEKSVVSITKFFPKRYTGHADEIKTELGGIIGLAKVKEFVFNLENNLQVQKLREDAGHKVTALARHMIFTGNPGTGKTTVARIVAKYFKAIGLLSTGQLREVTRADLVGQYVGHTAKQTNDVIQSALGGVLFIDEAYSLCRDKHDTFGLEAVDSLVKAVEDYRDDLIVILAGYQDEMREFLKNNPGLSSRFPH